MRVNCLFPNQAQRTAYNKGCKCEDCKLAERQRSINWNLNNKAKYKAIYTASNQKHRSTPSHRFSVSKSAAKRRGLAFELSCLEFSNLIILPCYYCGATPTGKETSSSLDRIDNSKGYLLTNVVPCCWNCNNLRGDKITSEEMKVAMAAIIELRNNKKQ